MTNEEAKSLKVGDKVRCTVDGYAGNLQKGAIYTISEIDYNIEEDNVILEFEENKTNCFLATDFDLIPKTIYSKMIESNGLNHQMMIMFEEFGELYKAYSKLQRANLIQDEVIFNDYKIIHNRRIIHDTKNFANNMLYHDFVKELADVEITLNYAKALVNPEILELCIERKMKKLETLSNEVKDE